MDEYYDDSFLIPCEICGIRIDNSEYNEHVIECQLQQQSERIHSSYQIPRGQGNLHDFLMEHFHVRRRRSTTSSFSSAATSPVLGSSPVFTSGMYEYGLGNDGGTCGVSNVAAVLHKVTEEENRDNTCCVCLDSKSHVVSSKLACRHIFCTVCIKKWLEKHNTCPMCKHVMA